MVTDVAPAPMSTRATPLAISSSVSTDLACAIGVKYFLAMAIPSSLKILSTVFSDDFLPMKSLKLPSKLRLITPTMSSSMSWKFSSSEKDWAMAP